MKQVDIDLLTQERIDEISICVKRMVKIRKIRKVKKIKTWLKYHIN